MADPTLGGAVGVLVVATGLVAGRCWRADKMPERPATFPYVTIEPMIADNRELSGDCRTLGRARLVQVDLWQKSKDEDFELPEQLMDALDGATLEASRAALSCKADDIVQVDDPTPGILHHAITLRIVYAVAAPA